ncbi:MAG: putative manganese transporter [Prevotellaceae bacterium]|jgi:hypothetical protein|nr:putative manganese transporter [Prevotellaceae bacterium]
MNFVTDFIDILRNTLLITGLVMVMMLLIEYINVTSHGKRLQRLQKTRFGQVVFAAILGLIPGCMGGFAAVSLFTHNVINFGALSAAFISATGDESFVMFATIPETAILLNILLFVLAIIVGVAVNMFVKKFPAPFQANHFAIHSEDHHHHHSSSKGSWKENLKNISFQRAILITGVIIFIVGLVSGLLDHSHDHGMDIMDHAHCDHDHGHEHHHHHDMNFLFNERWLNLLFVGVSVIVLYILLKVNDHFLSDHLWGHVIKKHFLKIFLWTLGALVFIYLIMLNVNIQDWVSDNALWILLIAILIGIIPESGPHMIFITLFASGHIPFSVFLANSIVQEGHSALPLLAESKRGFVWVKLLKIMLAAIAGLLGYFIGF